MNVPNKLTLSRILMTPVFLVTLVVDFPFHYFVSLAIFVFASVTDYFDGRIARQQKLITNFGKFLDPIADKMLTTAAFLAFMTFEDCYGMLWANFIILTREFLVSSVRMLAASGGGKVVAANIWGKWKTVVQMGAILLTVFCKGLLEFPVIADIAWLKLTMIIACNVVIWASVVLTVISGVIYAVQNKEFIGFKK